MTDEQKLRAAHFREVVSICLNALVDIEHINDIDQLRERHNKAIDRCVDALEAAAPLPDTHTVIPKAWLEEAAHDIEYWGSSACQHFQRHTTLEDDIQKWKERAKQP